MKMSDENSKTSGLTQTGVQSQQDQNTDDFVLDFGDNEETDTNIDSSNSDNNDNKEEIDSIEENKEENDEKLDKGGNQTDDSNTSADDFNISFDDFDVTKEPVEDNEEPVEDNEEIVEDNEEIVEDNEEIVEDNEEPVEDNEEPVEDNEEIVEDNEEIVEDNEEPVEDNEESVEDNEEPVEDNEEPVEDNEEPVEDNEEPVEDNEELAVESKDKDYDIFGDNDLFDREETSTQEVTKEDQTETESNNTEDNVKTIEDENKIEDNKGETAPEIAAEVKNDDVFGDGDLFNREGVNLPSTAENPNLDSVNDNVSEQTNNIESNIEENISDSIENIPVKQPEIGDLLGGSTVDFSPEDTNVEGISTENMTTENVVDNNQAEEIVQENNVSMVNNNSLLSAETSSNEGVANNINSTSEVNNIPQNISYDLSDNNVVTEENNQTINNTVPEAQSFVAQENVINETSMGNMVNNEVQINSQNVMPETSNIQQTVGTTIELKPTLSLDEILDSELNSNPQFANNSKAVPTNVPTRSGFFANKTAMLFAGIGIFVVIGLVAIFAMPSNNTVNTPVEVTYTGNNAENPGHQSGGNPEWGTGDVVETGDIVIYDDHNTSTGGAKTTDIKVFPDPDEECENGECENECENDDCEIDEKPNDPNNEPVLPYTGDNKEEPTDEISLEEVQLKISSFKSQGEAYYKQGDETQDRQLVRLSLKLISNCDDYQSKIQAGEGLNEEDFSSFKEEANGQIKTIESYLNPDDIEEFRQSNFNDEYYFDDKDKIKDHLYRTR